MSTSATGKAWGDIPIFGGTSKQLLISVKDSSGNFLTPSGVYQLWFKNASSLKPTDQWAYDNGSFSIVNVADRPATPGLPDIPAHQSLSVTILAGDTIARQGNRYNTQLYRVDTGITLAYGVLAVLQSAINPSSVPATSSIPITPTGLVRWNGSTLIVGNLPTSDQHDGVTPWVDLSASRVIKLSS